MAKPDDDFTFLESLDAEYDNEPDNPGWRRAIYNIIFKSDTRKGKVFDIILVLFILTNIGVLLLESMVGPHSKYTHLFHVLDKVYLVFFSLEVLLRITCVKWPTRYIFSFYGLIDVLSIIPSYLEHFFPETHVLMLIRAFRLLRVFRIFKLVKFLNESKRLLFAMIRSFRKILIFLFFVLLLTIFLGAIMYMLESGSNPQFSSIPQSIYWAIVTITTVGYGDVAPVTPAGKIVSSLIMILGYAIIAVPTGILSTSMMRESWRHLPHYALLPCPNCGEKGHESSAVFCKNCGTPLYPDNPDKNAANAPSPPDRQASDPLDKNRDPEDLPPPQFI
jgi:voltage-gated potassium channel